MAGVSTHVVEVFYCETVALDSTDAVYEEGACCTHEAACCGCWERVLERAKECMGMERWCCVLGRY